MNPRLVSGAFAWMFALIPSHGCGPFFSDTVLDKPQAALDVPAVSYLGELHRIAGTSPRREGASLPYGHPLVSQIPLESAELRMFWMARNVPAEKIDESIRHYESVRQILLSPIGEPGRTDFPTHGENHPQLAARPLGGEFPADIADYVEGARLHASGSTDEARALWKSILDRPLEEKHLRAAWAAWMLAKTSADLTECAGWYLRVETEIQAGAADAIGLRTAAKAWRGGLEEDPLAAMRLHYEAFNGGREHSAIDLRHTSRQILDKADPGILAEAAADPLIRQLLNLHLHALLDGPRQGPIEPPVTNAPFSSASWLAALEQHASKPFDDGARLAWTLYSEGRFDEARRWLGLSDPSAPLALWLQAKFDLRDGKLAIAQQHLAKAVELRSAEPDWKPANPLGGRLWFDGGTENQSAHQGRLLADLGMAALATKDYLPALESFRKGGYGDDANYLAEMVISTDGLIRHVRTVAPSWIPVAQEETGDSTPADPLANFNSGARIQVGTIGNGENQLRYLLARRLARQHRLKDAREFMPPTLLPLLDHYIALDRGRRSGKYKGTALAAIVWRQARIHRHGGTVLFSTEGAPDGGYRDWSYSSPSFAQRTRFPQGWLRDWTKYPEYAVSMEPQDKAIPPVTADEIARVRRSPLGDARRFHYRYAAADLAWEAARSLPANHRALLPLYNTAGLWLANQEPKSADRFYQAMVRRCAKTPDGQRADAKRWFLGDIPVLEDLPELPKEFMPPLSVP